MASKNKPYEQFGPFVLFKKLESDALGELWRAARIEGNQLGPLVALRRLTGGDRAALTASASTARDVVPLLNGTSFVKHQIVDVEGGVPYVSHEYANGRSLRHIVDRARGGNGINPQPIPIDQAIVIAEKVALSLATTADLRYQGNRLSHGAVIPQFIWISDDGEIRVAGQQLGKGLVGSLKDAKVGAELGRYFSPEYQTAADPSKTSEVYSIGAILYLLVTGLEPPDATNASAFTQAVGAAKTTAGTPVPDDIRAIIQKSLTLDPSARYGSVADMKTAISALANGGKYSATTFNLAFYLSSLLKKEMESEALEREKETKLNIAPYIEAPAPVAPVEHAHARSTPDFGVAEEPPKSKAPLAIAAALILGGIGIGAYFMLGKSDKQPATPTAVNAAAAAPVPQAPRIQPIVATATPPGTATDTTGTLDPEAARKKMFEEAVNRRLEEEVLKLQAEYTRSLQQQGARNAPVAAPAAVTAAAAPPPQTSAAPARPADDDRAVSAAALDAQRRETAPVTPVTASIQPQAAPAVVTPAVQQPAAVVPQPAAVVAAVREGDVVDMNSLDAPPVAVKPIRPEYPPLALRQRIEGSVILTALVSERGEVLDVKVLRGDGRFGLDDAAIRAVRNTRFSPAMKDGKRVRTWMPQIIRFKM